MKKIFNDLMGLPFTYTVLAIALSAPFINQAYGWTPGTGNESDVSGFAVDRESRNDVVSFWHAIYMESEGYQDRINWTGSISENNPGTVSTAFKGDVLRRLNYYRAMAGMTANMAMNESSTVLITSETPIEARPAASTTKVSAAQAAAMMISWNSAEYRTGGVAQGTADPHSPPTSWLGDTSIARNGAYYSNLAYDLYGPSAIDAYMHENDQSAGGGVNEVVGHRRLILFSRRTEFQTGDVTATSDGNYQAANALYSSGNILASVTPQFVSWPGNGYFPEPLATKYWSLSYPGADFSQATVSMTLSGGTAVSNTIVSSTAIFADNTLSWMPTEGEIPTAEYADQSVDVTVSNILVDGLAQSYSYTVTLINPDRLEQTLDLFGSLAPPDTGAVYHFDQVPHADSYRFRVASLQPSAWIESANDASAIINETNLTDAELRSTNAYDSSPRSLRLGFKVANEILAAVELDRTFIPNSGAELSFKTRRGVMLQTTTWAMQIKSGSGSWEDIKTLTNNDGVTNFPIDNSFISHTVVIPVTNIGKSSRLRMVYRRLSSSSYYWITDHPLVGVFTDEISLTNSEDVFSLQVSDYSGDLTGPLTLGTLTAGASLVAGNTYAISLGVTLGTKDFGYGNVMSVTPVAASSLSDYDAWARAEYPLIGNFDEDDDNDGIPNGIERVFSLNPMDGSDAAQALRPTVVNGNVELSHAIIPGGSVAAELSYTLLLNSWQDVSVSIVDDVATISVPITAPGCYLRWKVNESPSP